MTKGGGGNLKANENGLLKYVKSIRFDNDKVFTKNSTYARYSSKKELYNKK
jgi:hypothetical protein